MFMKLIWLSVAGAAGTLARYGLALGVQRLLGPAFPWGTLAVNALGCFLFGVVWMLWEDRGRISVETRTIVLVGFMGAFTTYSSFAFETAQQLREAEWLHAGLNIAAQTVVGLVCVFLGFAVGKWL
jgi:CrcB protein